MFVTLARAVSTDANGEYSIDAPSDAMRVLFVPTPGHEPQRPDLVIREDETAKLDIVLDVATTR